MKSLLQVILFTLTVVVAVSEVEPRVKIAVKKRIDGCKRKSKNGDILFIEYKGYFEDGTVFDTNIGEDVPYRLILGSGQVIKGWDEGLLRMCVGERRRLIVPPELGYGKEGSGLLVPPNAVLYFDVELVKLHNRIEL